SEHTLLHHPGLEKPFDQPENVAIGDLGSDIRHDERLWDDIEKPLDISIEYLGVPLPMEFQHPLHGHMTVACRPETIGVVVEDRLKERTQEEAKHLLSNAIADGGDAERPGFPVPLGDPDTAQGQGFESPALEFPHQGQQVLEEISLEQT